MRGPTLHVVIRTPREIVVEIEARALRVPTQTGQVGIRPGAEAAVTPIEPGLVLVRGVDGLRYVGTAGGLLRTAAGDATLSTPLAVVGGDPAEVVAAVTAAMSDGGSEQELRRAIERLERGLLREARREGGDRGG